MKIIRMTAEEIKALLNLMDAGVKHLGLAACNNAAALLQKLEQAEDEKPKRANPKSK